MLIGEVQSNCGVEESWLVEVAFGWFVEKGFQPTRSRGKGTPGGEKSMSKHRAVCEKTEP